MIKKINKYIKQDQTGSIMKLNKRDLRNIILKEVRSMNEAKSALETFRDNGDKTNAYLKEIVEKHGILAAVGFLFTELPYNTASAFLKIAADEALRGRLSDAYNESFDKFYEELSIIVHEEVGIK
jgi:hypothetical protein